MKTLFLHIGLHKTGTTTIQQTFQAASHLFRRQGLDFVPVGRHVGGAQHNLAWEAGELPTFDPALGTWDDAVAYMKESACACFLISAEDLSGLHPSRIAWLKRKLEGFRVRVVGTLRYQVDYLESLYNETAKVFCLKDREDFLKFALKDMDSLLDFARLWDNWVREFGEGNVTFAAFESLKGDLFANFCKAAGIAEVVEVPAYRKPSMNVSNNALFLEANRLLSEAGARTMDAGAYNGKLVDILNLAALELDWVKGRDPLFTLEERRRIHAKYLRANRKYAEKVAPLPGIYFTEPESGAEPPEVGAAEMADLAMRALVIQAQQHARDLAAVYRGARRFDEAIAVSRDALRLDPGRALLHQGLSAMLAGQGRIEEAEAEARKVLELAPDSAQSYRNLGYVLKLKGDLAGAERALVTAIEKELSLNIQPYIWLSEVRQAQGRASEALALIEEGLEIAPRHPEVLLRKAELLEELGKKKAARESFEAAVAAAPEAARTHFSFAHFLERQGRLRAALREARKAGELRPDGKAYSDYCKRLEKKLNAQAAARLKRPNQQDHGDGHGDD